MDVFFLWLVFTSNLISQTTWLKVKLKLELEFFSRNKLMINIVLFQSLWMFFLWLVFTSNLNSQTTWLKVKLKLVNFSFIDVGGTSPPKLLPKQRVSNLCATSKRNFRSPFLLLSFSTGCGGPALQKPIRQTYTLFRYHNLILHDQRHSKLYWLAMTSYK